MLLKSITAVVFERCVLRMAVLCCALLSLNACVGVAVVGAGAGVQSAEDTRTLGTQIDDETLEHRVLSRLRNDAELWSQSHLEVLGFNRLILIVGQTPNEAFRRRIGELAAQDPHLRRVINEVQVGAPSSIWNEQGDTWITAKVKISMLTESGFPSAKVKVLTEDGVVYLFGTLQRELAQKATQLASEVGGVNKVVSLLEAD